MAWIFSLWVETESKQQEEAILDYFEGKSIQIEEKQYNISAHAGGMITVDKISKSGIYNQDIAEEMTAIGFEFYHLLQDAPDFRFALVGVEVDGLRYWADLKETPTDIGLTKGFVIRADAYQELGKPIPMQVFRENYLWTPYQGETFVSK